MPTQGEVVDVRTRPARVLDRLSRPRTSGRYLPEIDGLRGLSILMVLVFHTFVAIHIASGAVTVPVSPFGAATAVSGTGIVDRLFRAGGGGVEMFFAISGFILAIPFLDARLGTRRRRVSVVGFYQRRLTRLEPPYLIALVVWAVVATLLGAGPADGVSRHLLAGATYAHQLWYGGENPLLGVAWSLEVEIVFYLLVPVIAASVSRISTPAVRRLSIILLGAVILAIAAGLGAPVLSAPWHAPFFLAGWLVADLYVTEPQWRTSHSGRWDLAGFTGLLLFIGLLMFGRPQDVLLLGPLTIGLLLSGVIRGRRLRDVLAGRAARTVGVMSYSVYLIHYPVLVLWARWVPGHGLWSGPLGGLFAAVGALVLSAMFFLTIERPCMDPTWPKRVASAITRRSRVRGPVITPVPAFVSRSRAL